MTRLFLASILLAGSLILGCGSPQSPAGDSPPADNGETDEVTVTGELEGVAAIGGESTGYGLATDDGQRVELDLSTHGLTDQFEEGKRVTVTGRYKTVTGVEIPERRVLEVTRISSAR